MAAVRLIRPARFVDDRGWLAETWSARTDAARGNRDTYVQDNHSYSRSAGTVRGLHFQVPPFGQAKLVRCLRGAIFDVAVDVRAGSPTFGAYVAATLTADEGTQLHIPVGCAHGFMTLEPHTEVAYKLTAVYAPGREAGVRFDDPDIAIAWPRPPAEAILSDKDRALPRLHDLAATFPFDGESLALVDG